MKLNEIEIDILESIYNKEISEGALSEDICDINGKNASLVIGNLDEKGLIITKDSNAGLGAKRIYGLTKKGLEELKKNS